MGGIIEDKIFEVLLGEKMSCKELQIRLKRISYERNYEIINKHLRKMFRLKRLDRKKRANTYVYWNPLERKKIYGEI